jgi:hypothetical protein
MVDDTTVYDAINAKPDTGDIPTKVSELDNDAGYLTQHQDITGKADKVSEATSGNFAGLDSNGNLTDSGHKHSDYLTSHQDISGKADKTEVNAAEAGYAIVIDGNTAPKAISSGQYLFIKNHSTLASGGYHATAAIASGGSISSSNVAADADGVVNAAYTSLNSKIAREFASNTDFNSYSVYDDRQNAYYYGTNISIMTNRPAAETNTFPFVLDVSNNGSYIIQKIVVYTANGVPNYYIRQQYYSYGTKVFGDWQLLALNSNLGGTKFLTFGINNDSVTINLGNVFRGILFSTSAYSSEEGVYSIKTSSTGGVSTGAFFASTGLTLNTSVNNKLTISSTRYVELMLIIMSGTASEA